MSEFLERLNSGEKLVADGASRICWNRPGLPLWAKPNAGLPRIDVETETAVYDLTPAKMGAYAKKYRRWAPA